MCKEKILRLALVLLVANANLQALAIDNQDTGVIFDILTYNVQMRPILDNNSYKASRISPKLNKYNIVALQESFSKKPELMKHCLHPFSAHHTDKYCFLSLVDSGLSTLSSFPIKEIKNIHFRSRAGLQDVIASKGILLTRVEINGNIIDIYNTHMQAEDGHGGALARIDQAKQIVEFINENSKAEHSIILIGDFNMSPQRFHRDVANFKQKNNTPSEQVILKNFAFTMMQESLNLEDLSDTLLLNELDDYDRILFKSGSEHKLKPISIEKPLAYFTDEHAELLSDGTPIVGTFSLRPLSVTKNPKEISSIDKMLNYSLDH